MVKKIIEDILSLDDVAAKLINAGKDVLVDTSRKMLTEMVENLTRIDKSKIGFTFNLNDDTEIITDCYEKVHEELNQINREDFFEIVVKGLKSFLKRIFNIGGNNDGIFTIFNGRKNAFETKTDRTPSEVPNKEGKLRHLPIFRQIRKSIVD